MNRANNIIAPQGLKLDGVVAYWSQLRPEQTAIEYDVTYETSPLTWGMFEQYVQGTAQWLAPSISRGDRVAVVCDDNIDFHVLLNALWRRGASVLLINRTWGAALVQDLLQLTECQTLYCKNWSVQLGEGQIQKLPYPKLRQPSSCLMVDLGDIDDVAIIAATSGTTDQPKCVAISHRMIRAAYKNCLSIHNFERVHQAASLFPLNALGVLGVCFLLPREVGASTFVFPPFSIANIRQSWDTLLRRDIDFVYLVPPIVRLLNTLPAYNIERNRLPVLSFCASAPVQLEELRRLESKFPVTVYNVYGLTEMTFAVFFGCRDQNGQSTDSIGYPLGIEARLVDKAGKLIEGSGRGELYLKGPMCTKGYIGNLSDTAITWDGDWLRTGDIAERDTVGRYYIRGRLKDAVIRGGILYYLHELEHYLRRAPHVVDACAFKGRNLPSGDEIGVVVQVDCPMSPYTLLEWVRKSIGEDKVPNILFIWECELPRNSNGKVLRNVLAEMYRAGNLK